VFLDWLLIPVDFVAAALIAFAINWLSAIPSRRAVSLHWAERARLLWPSRTGAAANVILLPLAFGALQFAIDRGFAFFCLAAALSSWLGAILGTYPLDQETFPAFTFRQWLRVTLVSWSLRILVLVVWVSAALLMPDSWSWQCIPVVLAVLAFQSWLHFGLWRAIVTRGGLLIPANESLQTIVRRTAPSESVLASRVWMIDSPVASAYALPVTRELLFSTGLLKICTGEEVAAICSHEIAHLTESKRILTMRVLGSMSYFPLLFMRPAINSFGIPFGIFIPFFPSVLFAVATRRLSQRMEKRADGMAAEQQHSPGIYARALEKIYRANLAPAVIKSRRQIHPHLYDRMIAAGIQPDFPRPKAAEALSAFHFGLWVLLGIAVGFAFAKFH
jgi:Zn-dependent protease with chaperone function